MPIVILHASKLKIPVTLEKPILLFFVVCLIQGCQQHPKNASMNNHEYTNSLIHESSPYLLQHAHNPVDWHPWGEEALTKAKKEDKPLLISIGYSACHWCHVMEHESFEDPEVATLMNENFVCIKVDREERPDIDQVYMDAVQLMTRQGGWPLNCFALPDGRPFYGGTYFKKEQWISVLQQLNSLYRNNRDKVEEYAEKLTEGLQQTNLISATKSDSLSSTVLEKMVEEWSQSFDRELGGPNRAPKFPLPNNLEFLLNYGHLAKDDSLLSYVKTTLDHMLYGGIYDQVGGGFARYSVDVYWKVPHFEKMLYDNGQLLSLYSKAYQKFKDPEYKRMIDQTIAFCNRDLSKGKGFYFSALDADSEGEEGKFYIWSIKELKTILKEDFELFADFYQLGEKTEWEGHYILMQHHSPQKVAEKYTLSLEQLLNKREAWITTLQQEREKREKPGLDDKTITSWNALMAKGLIDAAIATGNKKYFQFAERTLTFITEQQRMEDGGLYHTYKEGTSKIPGYLEDYSFTLEALVAAYQYSFNERYLQVARQLSNYTLDHFWSEENGFFHFVSHTSEKLITQKVEVTDNVIPASNTSLAKGLFQLGKLLDNGRYQEMALHMLQTMGNKFIDYPSGFSNWALLYTWQTFPFYEVAITGNNALSKSEKLQQNHFIPNALFLGQQKESTFLPLLKNKYTKNKTTLYVCVNKACQLPTTEISEAVEQIKTPVH